MLDLVRVRTGKPDEVFHLDPLFEDEEVPGRPAVLQKWDTTQADFDKWMAHGPKDFQKQMSSREIAKAMNFGDYAHEGSANTFMLQVGASPCGHTQNVVVGVTKANPTLHALSTVEHPERPLVLGSSIWKAFLESKGASVSVMLECMDHGSDIETRVHVYQDAKGLHARSESYECDEQGKVTAKLSADSPPEDL